MCQSDEDSNGPGQIVLKRETSTKAIWSPQPTKIHIRKEGEFQLQGYIPKNNHTIGKRIMVGSFPHHWVVASSRPISKPSQYQCLGKSPILIFLLKNSCNCLKLLLGLEKEK